MFKCLSVCLPYQFATIVCECLFSLAFYFVYFVGGATILKSKLATGGSVRNNLNDGHKILVQIK